MDIEISEEKGEARIDWFGLTLKAILGSFAIAADGVEQWRFIWPGEDHPSGTACFRVREIS